MEKIPLFKVFMSPDVGENVNKVLYSGFVTQGKKVEEFEGKLKSFFNYPHVLTVNSGTSGLTLALRLLNLPKNSIVFSTALTCTATNWAIMANGNDIRWVDVDKNTCNIDLDDLEIKIKEQCNKDISKIGAIMIVHWGGYPLDMNRLKEIQTIINFQYNRFIPIIEDCAHAFGGKFEDKFLGTFGNISVFSLQAIKHLTCGDGGLIFLPNEELYKRAKLLRWFGIDREHRSGGKDLRLEDDIPEWGYKFHMNDINATIGSSNLSHIGNILKRHRDNAKWYNENLKNINGIELLDFSEKFDSSYWIYTLKVADKTSFMEFMNEKNIMVSQVHNRNDIHSCVLKFKCSLPNLDKLEKEIISIPVGWWVSNEQREYILKSIKEWSCLFFSIRHLEPKDYDKNFLSLLSQLNNFEYKMSRLDFENNLNNIYVIERQNKLVATGKLFIETKFGQSVGHIEDIVVDNEHRNKQIGKVLVSYLISLSKEKNCYKCVLNCKDELGKFYKNSNMKREGCMMCVRF
jgi:dTDP-4-amino-4,6-dideoxygalactose transaminase